MFQMSSLAAESVNHSNPCNRKIQYPILKQSAHDVKSELNPKLNLDVNVIFNMNMNLESQNLRRKASCPQIIKIRNNKISSPNEIKDEDSLVYGKKRKIKKYINSNGYSIQNGLQDNRHDEVQNINSYYISKDQLKLLSQLTHKNSVQTLMSYQQNDSSLTVTPRPNNFLNKKCLNQQIHSQLVEKLFQQNIQLTKQLQKRQKKIGQKQNQYNKLEQQYIRFLQITNQRSQSKIKILLQEGQSRLNKSKIKSSVLSQKASQIKTKLEGLQISTIKSTRQTQRKNINQQKQNTDKNNLIGRLSQLKNQLNKKNMQSDNEDKESFIKLSEIM